MRNRSGFSLAPRHRLFLGAMAVVLAATAFAYPIYLSVTITCGTKKWTGTMKMDSGADGTTLSRARAQAMGLLDPNGDKKDPNDFDADKEYKNANGTKVKYYVTKPCDVEVTDSNGKKCTFKVPIVVPSKGGPDISNLLGNNWLDQVCYSSKKKSCKVAWEDWTEPPPPPKKTVPEPQKSTPNERSRYAMPGSANSAPCEWVHGTATKSVIIGNALAQQLNLNGPQVNLQQSDPELFASLSFGGFLGDDPNIPFELVQLSLVSVGVESESITIPGPIPTLINRQSDENIISQDVIESSPYVDIVSTIFPLGMMVLRPCVSFYDGFESYPPFSPLAPQGNWQIWYSGGDNGVVTPTTGGQALQFQLPGLTQGGTDVVQVFNKTSGKWVFSAYTFVPSNSPGINKRDGYVLLLNNYNGQPDPNKTDNWSMQVRFSPVDGVVESQFDNNKLPLIPDQWIELRAEIDLGANTFTEYYNGQILAQNLVWSENASGGGNKTLACVDLYSDAIEGMLIDDVLLACVLPSCPPDLNGDGAVGQADLGILLAAYGTCPGDPGYIPAAGAIGGDLCVGQEDLGVLLAFYGQPCP